MNYEETINYLYNSAPMFQQIGSKAYKKGMENTFSIDIRMNHPHINYQTLHIAGTNGKGSTSHLIASILKQSGYKVGLYTSPHLTDFRERIKINGKMISQSFVIDYIAQNLDFFKEIQPSFFELTTGMAFSYFAQEHVDVAVIEVGLGGRLDCTNIIRPDLSVITNISFDHMALLGYTLPEIAREKAGIIKPGVPVVIGEANEEVKNVFMEKYLQVSEECPANEKAPIIFAEDENPILSASLLPSGQWLFEAKDYPGLIGELGGLAQEKNAATVLCAIKELKRTGYNIPDQAVYEGFSRVVETTGLTGRWQIIQNHPKIVLDTGHNAGGMEYIVRQLKTENYDQLHMIIGMVNDKDISAVLQLLPADARYYFTQASIPRALDAGELAERAKTYGLSGHYYPSVKEACETALKNATKKDFIFIGGSTFVVADALDVINNHKRNNTNGTI